MNILTSITTMAKDCLRNDYHAFRFFANGSLTAFFVNRMAHHVFDLKEESKASYAAKAVAVLAGITVCVLASKPSLGQFSGDTCIEMGLAITIVTIASAIIGDPKNCITPSLMMIGIPIGYFGTRSLVVLAAAGAFFGAILKD